MQLVSMILFLLFQLTLGPTIFSNLVPLVLNLPFQQALGPTFFPLDTSSTNWENIWEWTHSPGTRVARSNERREAKLALKKGQKKANFLEKKAKLKNSYFECLFQYQTQSYLLES